MLKIANKEFKSRLILGTGKFGRLEDMYNVIAGSEAEMVTLALKRIDLKGTNASIIDHLSISSLNLLPNTSGARNAREAILAAHMAREAMETNWVKLEIHPDPRYLLPDAIETLIATEQLVKDGFVVLPYIHADPVLCKRLEDVGTAAVMPLGSPIGSNQGLITIDFLEIIIEQSKVPVIVDAVKAMEIGADAVLVNTAIAVAKDPVQMAIAFREAVKAGRLAFESGLGSKMKVAQPSSPLTGFLNLP